MTDNITPPMDSGRAHPPQMNRGVGVAVPTGGLNVRVVATGMLVVMAIVFISAKYFQDVHPAVGFVRAFAEAAMVGGLADWFAVTALFRHPLGLPIPHTAIVPRNKNRIGDTLARFLLTNFLLPRLIARKMQTLDVAGAVGKFLSQPAEGGGRLKLGASRVIADALGALDQQRLGGMVKSAIADRLRELDVAPLLGQALQAALAEGRHQPLLDAMVKWGSKTLELNDHLIHQMVHDNSNAIVRFTGLDESISNRIVAGLGKLLSEMAVETDHPLRIRVEEGLAKMALDLQHEGCPGPRRTARQCGGQALARRDLGAGAQRAAQGGARSRNDARRTAWRVGDAVRRDAGRGRAYQADAQPLCAARGRRRGRQLWRDRTQAGVGHDPRLGRQDDHRPVGKCGR
jgi:hypothetical protein